MSGKRGNGRKALQHKQLGGIYLPILNFSVDGLKTLYKKQKLPPNSSEEKQLISSHLVL